MAVYLSPGVYIEEIPSGARPIEGGGTSTALFAGHALRGPVGAVVLVTGFDAYEQLYGGIRDTGAAAEGDALGHSVRAFFQNGGTRAYVARLVRDDPATRERDPPGTGETTRAVALVLNRTDPTTLIGFTAKNEGTWARALRVQIAPSALGDDRIRVDIGPEIAAPGGSKVQPLESFEGVSLVAGEPGFIKDRLKVESTLADAVLGPVEPFMLGTSISQPDPPPDTPGTFDQLNGRTMTVRVNGADRVVTFPADAFTAETTLDAVADFIETAVRKPPTTPATRDFTCTVRDNRLVLTSGRPRATASVVVTGPRDATDAADFLRLGLDNEGEERTGMETLAALVGTGAKPVPFTGGVDRRPPNVVDYQALFTSLVKVRDINIVTLPGRHWGSDDDQPIIDHALTYAEDTKRCMVLVDPPKASELSTPSQIQALGLPTSTYSVMYYPWLRVSNPFFDRERNPGVPATVLVPPSGFAAGLWAKTDGRRGVWKAPAGVEFQLLGSAGPGFDVDDVEQQALNPLGINAIRRLPNFGQVVWGARTLSTLASPEWRYVPVRRTAIFIEQSIYNGIQWAVFEPNDHRLWASLRANIASFMDGLFRSGAFQGETAQQAYFVRCNLGDSMTQDDIDAGRVIVIVGFAPVKPAEFVIIRLQQKVGQQ